MNEELSIKHQKIAGTYNRNEEIKRRYRKRDGQKLANEFGISRERIRQILKLPCENHQPKKRRWWQLWKLSLTRRKPLTG